MSWRHEHYRTRCRTCGLVGNLRISTSEQGVRSSWAAVSQAQVRPKAPKDSTGVCDGCGGTDIEVGAVPDGG